MPATAGYWTGAIPAMLFPAGVMLPFQRLSRGHPGRGDPERRHGEPAREISIEVLSLTVAAHILPGSFRPATGETLGFGLIRAG
jgi:hypothetical protein